MKILRARHPMSLIMETPEEEEAFIEILEVISKGLLGLSDNADKFIASLRPTTRYCPNCGNTNLVEIRTQNVKHCVDCNTAIQWELSPGQKPLR